MGALKSEGLWYRRTKGLKAGRHPGDLTGKEGQGPTEPTRFFKGTAKS